MSRLCLLFHYPVEYHQEDEYRTEKQNCVVMDTKDTKNDQIAKA